MRQFTARSTGGSARPCFDGTFCRMPANKNPAKARFGARRGPAVLRYYIVIVALFIKIGAKYQQLYQQCELIASNGPDAAFPSTHGVAVRRFATHSPWCKSRPAKPKGNWAADHRRAKSRSERFRNCPNPRSSCYLRQCLCWEPKMQSEASRHARGETLASMDARCSRLRRDRVVPALALALAAAGILAGPASADLWTCRTESELQLDDRTGALVPLSKQQFQGFYLETSTGELLGLNSNEKPLKYEITRYNPADDFVVLSAHSPPVRDDSVRRYTYGAWVFINDLREWPSGGDGSVWRAAFLWVNENRSASGLCESTDALEWNDGGFAPRKQP